MNIQELLQESEFDVKVNSIYKNKDGKLIPRVTDILSSTISEPYLLRWANSLGYKRLNYDKELQKAANIGTQAHTCIEKYLKAGLISSNVPFLNFLDWWTKLNENNTVEILMIEEKLVGEYFAGTLDTLISINGKKYLIDYKTSNHIGFKHFLQASAYRNLLYTLKNINIDGVIILQLDKKENKSTEYVLDFSIPEHYNYIEDCIQCFYSLVYTYYNTINVRNRFDTIFKGV